jgi:hypothetical protein
MDVSARPISNGTISSPDAAATVARLMRALYRDSALGQGSGTRCWRSSMNQIFCQTAAHSA